LENIGYKEIELKLPTDYNEHDLKKKIEKQLHVSKFSYEILKKSLDARFKPSIYWLLKLRVLSKELKGSIFSGDPHLEIPYQKRNKNVVVVGSGPAGFFAAFTLIKAGFGVTLIEKGPQVNRRFKDIVEFEQGGAFKSSSNYCHGEGGAGTFSDGKLTSRTKNIVLEKNFVFDNFIAAGAPEEIKYLAMPHIGSDNLRFVIPNLRKKFESLGGKSFFDTKVTDLHILKNGQIEVNAENQDFVCDYLVFAPGHSSYDTYRMLHRKGIIFRNKPFAIGVRVEHPQELINRAQWLSPKLPGVKAAEYKLTYQASNGLPVYSFCMCPGGKVVPSAPEARQSIVNGVSDYSRNSPFANSANVVGVDLSRILKKEVGFEESLRWLETLEQKVYDIDNSFRIPACTIKDFTDGKVPATIPENSYPLGFFPYDFSQLFPTEITEALKEGFVDFSHKIRGYETGVMLGLESKTSSPVQAVRDEHRRCEGFDNIFIIGEGSGYTGGIVSSAVDGVKLAMDISGMV